MQSYWSALQFAPTNLPVFYRGMPQASHGNIDIQHPSINAINHRLLGQLNQEVGQLETGSWRNDHNSVDSQSKKFDLANVVLLVPVDCKVVLLKVMD